VYRLLSVLAVGAALVFGFTPGHASAPSPSNPAGNALGIVPTHGQAHNQAKPGGSGNLVYHSGGAVETGTHYTYAIYWNPWGAIYSPTYQSLINGYFQNVAADSGKTSNVYYSDTQYYQNIGGATTNITYSEAFAGSGTDATTPSSSGCSSTAGGTLGCVSDAQVQQEVQSYITAHNLPDGPNYEYFVFLGNGVSTCSGTSCFVSYFCAYHSSFTDSAGHTVIYANMPYTGYNLSACGSGQYPNNDSAADSTINVTSHEANESITDYLGNAWYDRTGYENGDKCAWKFGTTLGSTSYGAYNQAIGSGKYYLQGEWSNHSSGCVWSGT
jgi:hypothetical protein